MSRRIDIELTSSREDGSWTWRAAGAKQPKGSLAGSLLPAGAAVGDILRAEVDAGLDGTEVLGVTAPKAKKDSGGERIELLTSQIADDQLVTTKLAGRRGGGDRGPRREGRARDDRGPRRDGERGARDGRSSGGPGGPGGPRGDRSERGPRREGDRGPRGERPDRPRRERPAPPTRPKAKRLRAGRTHRKAAIETLRPEEQVIAELVLRGGIPALRQAVTHQNEQAKAEGHPVVKVEPVVAVAERLLPALRAADWRDRAEAAVTDLDELDLRDLRSVVVAAEGAARDEETRALAEQLREGLARRVDQEQQSWLAEIAATLDDGRVVRALRLSSRPPKAGAPLPAELATRLTEATAAALTSDTVADRWAAVLDALGTSPVRLVVEPASRPENPNPELLAVIKRAASRVPKVAAAFGIDAPAEKRRGGRPGSKPGGRRPTPPPPPKPDLAAASPTPDAQPEPAPEPESEPAQEVQPESESEPTQEVQPESAPEVDAAPETPTPAPDEVTPEGTPGSDGETASD